MLEELYFNENVPVCAVDFCHYSHLVSLNQDRDRRRVGGGGVFKTKKVFSVSTLASVHYRGFTTTTTTTKS